MIQIKISKIQAKEIAFCIVGDIVSYINEHKTEYENFLRQEFREEVNTLEKP